MNKVAVETIKLTQRFPECFLKQFRINSVPSALSPSPFPIPFFKRPCYELKQNRLMFNSKNETPHREKDEDLHIKLITKLSLWVLQGFYHYDNKCFLMELSFNVV